MDLGSVLRFCQILGSFGSHFGSFWGHFRPIGVPNWSQKSVLRHLVGPMAPPRGPKGAPWEPKGASLVDFGMILA